MGGAFCREDAGTSRLLFLVTRHSAVLFDDDLIASMEHRVVPGLAAEIRLGRVSVEARAVQRELANQIRHAEERVQPR